MPSGSPQRLAAGLVVALLVAASWALPSSAGAEAGFCSKPVPALGEAPPAFKARLGVDRKTVGPGGKVRFRIENLGAETVMYGHAYRLAHQVRGEWIHLPTGPFFSSMMGAQPGYAGECQVIEMAKDAEAGVYRIAKEVRPFDRLQPKAVRKAVVIRATFRVR